MDTPALYTNNREQKNVTDLLAQLFRIREVLSSVPYSEMENSDPDSRSK